MKSVCLPVIFFLFSFPSLAQFYGEERLTFKKYLDTHTAFASYSEAQREKALRPQWHSWYTEKCAKYVLQYMAVAKIASTDISLPMRASFIYYDLRVLEDNEAAKRFMPGYKPGEKLSEEKEREICIATVNNCKAELVKFENNLGSCNHLFKQMMEEKDIKREEITWTGTWESKTGYGNYEVIISPGSSATTTHSKSNGYTDKGSWTGCGTERDTLVCNWTEQYEDQDKKVSRSGIVKISLNFDNMAGYFIENEPSITWKPGVAKYTSAMKKGARWPLNMNRKK